MAFVDWDQDPETFMQCRMVGIEATLEKILNVLTISVIKQHNLELCQDGDVMRNLMELCRCEVTERKFGARSDDD